MAEITITFNNQVPAPALGYVVKYREAGTGPWNQVTPNPSGSPVVISGLPADKRWEGTIQAKCSLNTSSPEIPWEVDDRIANEHAVNGLGQTAEEACLNDPATEIPLIWSPCAVISGGCVLYTNVEMTARLQGYLFIILNGSLWEMDLNGTIIQFATVQC